LEQEIFLNEVIVVGEASVLKAQRHLTGCSICCETASHPFDSVLSQVLGNPETTQHFLWRPISCPRCASSIIESTLVTFDSQFVSSTDASNVVFIDEPILRNAETFVACCEYCTDALEIPFNQLLGALTGCDPKVTEYVICQPAYCPRCRHEITEKTFILRNGRH
jgi:hypothetical protein